MKRRRWLPFVALAALAPASLLACIVSIDESRIGQGADASVDGPSGADALRSDAPLPTTETGSPCWDGASPARLVFSGKAFVDHIHVDILEGAGPPFSVRVADLAVPAADDAALGSYPQCTTSFDDEGGMRAWERTEDGFLADHQFLYTITFAGEGDGGVAFPYAPVVTVQALNADESAAAGSTVEYVCARDSDADACAPVDAD